ncbi:MAG: hypothetical protein WB869_09615, partial [Candidatus Acidiferrales bacterium]
MTIATFTKIANTPLMAAPGAPLTPAAKVPPGLPAVLFAGAIIMIGVFLLCIAIYKSLRNRADAIEAWKSETPNTENA